MHYPTIINAHVDDIKQHISLRLNVPHDLIYFTGHFPDFPLLPGVVQLGWAIHYAKEMLSVATSMLSIDQIKFTHVILPGDNISLELTCENQRLHFNYYKDNRLCSSGKIKLEETYE